MKHILLFLLLSIGTECRSQFLIPNGNDGERVAKACSILKEYEPDVYNAVISQSHIQIFINGEGKKFLSTNSIEGGSTRKYWILLGAGSVRERSTFHLASVIYHEALHILIAEGRIRNGQSGYFSHLSKQKQKQEEFLLYKRMIDLLVRMDAPRRDIQEIREWMEPYKSR